jgi:hypothetical protein
MSNHQPMVPAVEVPPRYVKPMIKQARERDESFKNYETYKTRIEEEVRHPEMDNLIGAIGELAFAEYADIQMDTDIYQAGDTGADFHVNALDDEMHIDVKTRSGDLFAFWVEENSSSLRRENPMLTITCLRKFMHQLIWIRLLSKI